MAYARREVLQKYRRSKAYLRRHFAQAALHTLAEYDSEAWPAMARTGMRLAKRAVKLILP